MRCDVIDEEERRTCNRCLRSRSECTWSQKSALTAGFAGSFHTFSIGERNKPPSETIPASGARVQELLNAELSSRLVTEPKRALNKKTPKACDAKQTRDLEIQTPLDRSRVITHAILRRTTGLSLQAPGDENERRLYHYWRVEAAPDIFGHSNDAFWDGSILSWGHEEPVVRLTIVALASFHRNFIFTPNSNSSLYHYNKAIKAVQNVLGRHQKPSLQVILCSCLFFYRIEGIRGEDEARRKHLQAGFEIIKEATPEELEKVDPAIMEIFTLLDITNSYWSAFQTPCQLVSTTHNERSGIESCVPATFPTLQAASSVLAKLSNWGLQFFHSSTPKNDLEAVEQEASHLQAEYERWERAFMPLKKKYIDPRPFFTHLSETISAIGLYIAFLNTRICVFSQFRGLTPDESDSEMNPEFNKMLQTVETLISIYKTQGSGILQPRSIFFVRGVVTSTILVAINTKDKYTLARVLKVMEDWPISEGFFDGSTRGVKGTMELAMKTATLAGPLSENSSEDLGRLQEKLLDLESMRLDDRTNLRMWGQLTHRNLIISSPIGVTRAS